jgi:hypothetical protein
MASSSDANRHAAEIAAQKRAAVEAQQRRNQKIDRAIQDQNNRKK